MDSGSDIKDSIEIEGASNRLADFVDDEISRAVEALLFASPGPLSATQLARLLGREKRQISSIIDGLNNLYAEWDRSFRIERFGDGYRLYSLKEYDKYISRLAEIPRPAKLSRAALEVLAIIAYKQPLIRPEIERIRGIDSDGVIRTLLERGLIAVCGRSDGPGRPLLYKTAQEFLEFFGISDLSELPPPESFVTEHESGASLTIVRPQESSDSDDD